MLWDNQKNIGNKIKTLSNMALNYGILLIIIIINFFCKLQLCLMLAAVVHFVFCFWVESWEAFTLNNEHAWHMAKTVLLQLTMNLEPYVEQHATIHVCVAKLFFGLALSYFYTPKIAQYFSSFCRVVYWGIIIRVLGYMCIV